MTSDTPLLYDTCRGESGKASLPTDWQGSEFSLLTLYAEYHWRDGAHPLMTDRTSGPNEPAITNDPTTRLRDLLLETQHDGGMLDRIFRQVHESVLDQSPYLNDNSNFTRIGSNDLARMFDFYDNLLLGGKVRSAVEAQGSKLEFALSRRLTRSGGQTKRTRPSKSRPFAPARYEIAVSVPVLFATFSEVDRPIRACGRLCYNRLEALQRIMEHEMLHLAEMLGWDRSNCAARRFKALSLNVFGHTESHHQMITPQERAIVHFGVKPGAKVTFDWEGRQMFGVVNSIRRRVTVLVLSPKGIPYSDGHRYEKFYVPVERLKPVNG